MADLVFFRRRRRAPEPSPAPERDTAGHEYVVGFTDFSGLRFQLDDQQPRAVSRSAEPAGDLLGTSKSAEELLLSLLNDEQKDSYRRNSFFEVRGSGGGRWRIYCSRGQTGNVSLETAPGVWQSYCAHLLIRSNADTFVAQMMRIITDEPGFLRTANRYSLTDTTAVDW